MAKVINFARRSEGTWYEVEEIEPQTYTYPTALRALEAGAAIVRGASETIGEFFLPSVYGGGPARVAAGARELLGVTVPRTRARAEIPAQPPPAAPQRATGPLMPVAKLGITPEQLTRLQTEQKIRDQAIKNYLAQPLAYVWAENKKLPGVLEKVGVGKRVETEAQLQERFPLPTIPIPPELIQPPESQPIFRGWLRVEPGGERFPEGKTFNMWEDAKGNEITGRRDIAGTSGPEY